MSAIRPGLVDVHAHFVPGWYAEEATALGHPMPDGMPFWPAAVMFGWWLPPLPADLPVFAAMPHEGSRPRRAGLKVTRHTQPFPVVTSCGLPVTTPAETLLACAADLDLLDVLVLVDAALHLGSCTIDDIEAAMVLRRRGCLGGSWLSRLCRHCHLFCFGRQSSAAADRHIHQSTTYFGGRAGV